MKVKAEAYIRHDGIKYGPNDVFEIEEKDYEKLMDIVEVVEDEDDKPDNFTNLGDGPPEGSKEESDSGGAGEKEDTNDTGQPGTLDLSKLNVSELRAIAKERDIKGYSNMKKEELLEVL